MIDPVDQHLAFRRLVEPRHKAGQRGLAGAGLADHPDPGAVAQRVADLAPAERPPTTSECRDPSAAAAARRNLTLSPFAPPHGKTG